MTQAIKQVMCPLIFSFFNCRNSFTSRRERRYNEREEDKLVILNTSNNIVDSNNNYKWKYYL